jgi:hypothetical protein
MKFKCVSTHPEPLADGRVLAPFEEVDLTQEQYEHPGNLHLFHDDKLLPFSKKGEQLVEERKEAEAARGVELSAALAVETEAELELERTELAEAQPTATHITEEDPSA